MLTGSTMRRRSLLRAATAVGGATLLAACGATPTPQVVEKVVEKEVTKIVEGTPVVVKETVVVTETQVVEKVVTVAPAAEPVVHIKYLEFPSRDLNGITGMAKQYSEERDGKVVVDVVIEPDDVYVKLATMHMAGDPADVTQWGLNTIDLAIRDIILKLDDLLDRDGIKIEDEFNATAIQGVKYSAWGVNGYYGVPLYINLHYVAYNRTLLDQAGVPVPPSTIAEAWTCEQFAEYATSMTDEAQSLWGCTSMNNRWDNDANYYGAHSFDEGGTKVLWDDDAIAAFQWVSDLLNKYKCAPSAEQSQALGGGSIFLTGKVGMGLGSGWDLPAYREITDFEWGIAVEPSSAGDKPYRSGILMPNCWVIDSTTQHREEAWDFIKWMTLDPQHNADQCKVYGSASPSKKGLPILMEWYKEQYGIDTTALVELLSNSAITGDGRFATPNWAACENDTDLNSQFDALMLGRIDAKEFVATIAPELEAVLGKEYAGRTAAG